MRDLLQFFHKYWEATVGSWRRNMDEQSSRQNVSYDISTFTHNTKHKLIRSEDSFYFHKAALMGYSIFNSEEENIHIAAVNFRDAIKQRRRWVWGQIAILNRKMLPLPNRIRLSFIGFSGLWLLLYWQVRVAIILFRRR